MTLIKYIKYISGILFLFIIAIAFYWQFSPDFRFLVLHKGVWQKKPLYVKAAFMFGAEVGNEKDRVIGGLQYGAPLLGAVMTNQNNLAQELIDRGSSVNSLYDEGYSLLGYCIVNDRLEMAKLLLANRADPDLKTFYGTPKEFAEKEGKKTFIELLNKVQKKPNHTLN